MLDYANRFAQYELALGDANQALAEAATRIDELKAEIAERDKVIGQLRLQLAYAMVSV